MVIVIVSSSSNVREKERSALGNGNCGGSSGGKATVNPRIVPPETAGFSLVETAFYSTRGKHKFRSCAQRRIPPSLFSKNKRQKKNIPKKRCRKVPFGTDNHTRNPTRNLASGWASNSTLFLFVLFCAERPMLSQNPGFTFCFFL